MKLLFIVALNISMFFSESAFASTLDFFCVKENDEMTGGELLFKEQVDNSDGSRIQELFETCEAKGGRGTVQPRLPRL